MTMCRCKMLLLVAPSFDTWIVGRQTHMSSGFSQSQKCVIVWEGAGTVLQP